MAPKVPVTQSPTAPWVDRLVALLVATSGAALVYLLAAVRPDPRGHGTHVQLGMLPCSWPDTVGVPCPTCGVTTAACHLVHLSPLSAVATQPFGAVLAGVGIWSIVWAAYCLVTARSFLDPFVRLPYGTITRWGLVLLLGSWLYTYLTFPS